MSLSSTGRPGGLQRAATLTEPALLIRGSTTRGEFAVDEGSVEDGTDEDSNSGDVNNEDDASHFDDVKDKKHSKDAEFARHFAKELQSKNIVNESLIADCDA